MTVDSSPYPFLWAECNMYCPKMILFVKLFVDPCVF